jgi:hypothetical protein
MLFRKSELAAGIISLLLGGYSSARAVMATQ